ncbi:ankyrin-1-like [Scylla paramamosain]|uniref:ankyrin-1-like n=1 Tax=Scylla paramamosain TaxID=85552 RepID=UPI0030835B41
MATSSVWRPSCPSPLPLPHTPRAHTPVHLASYYGHVEVLEQLAGAGWPLTARDSDGNTPMHSAAAGGRVTCVQWLVQRGGDTSMQNNAGHTPLDEAGLSIEGGGTTDITPLMMAAQYGHAQTVKALLDLRGNPLAMDSRGEAVLAYTPVHLASYRGHVEVLEQLAGAGWPLTARDSDGNTPMHSAAAGGRVTCVQWLVQRGGDTSMQNNAGHTPLDKAGLSIEGGGTTDITPLMMAAQNGHAHTVKALLDLRDNPLVMNSRAVCGGPLARHLSHSRTPEAHTPVHLASYYGHVEVLEQLAGAGWPLTARDSDGNTPMHSAAAGGRVTCVAVAGAARR